MADSDWRARLSIDNEVSHHGNIARVRPVADTSDTSSKAESTEDDVKQISTNSSEGVEVPSSFNIRAGSMALLAVQMPPINESVKDAYLMIAAMLHTPSHSSPRKLLEALNVLPPYAKKAIFKVDNVPLLFYAIERFHTIRREHPVVAVPGQRKQMDVLTLFLRSGADPTRSWTVQIDECTTVRMDPLTLAIVHHGYKPYEDCIKIVGILLAYGADPHVIPAELLQYEALSSEDLLHIRSPYPSYFLKHMNSRLNTVVKYFILKAQRLGQVPRREIAWVQKYDLEEIRRADFFEIGQEHATRRIHETLIMRSMKDLKTARPLVFAFAGPSGHGKTNLALAMGEFTGCEVLGVNCNEFSENFVLFGSPLGYEGSEKGSPLNNHLAEHSRKRSVVVLDEFDKTEQSIRDCFLAMWDRGVYMDRRDNTPVDCSKTIFIICTNAGLKEIETFWRRNKANVAARKLSQADYDHFARTKVRKALLHVWGAPLVSRLTAVVPFLFFTPEEQAVGAAQCFFVERRNLGPSFQILINFDNGQEWEVVQALAGDYEEACGYRSIEEASDSLMLGSLSRKFREVDADLPEEEKDMEEYRFQTSAADKTRIVARKLDAIPSATE